MGAGIAKHIKELWPRAYEEYKTVCEEHIWNKSSPLGLVLISETEGTKTKIAHLFAQNDYGQGGRYTSYDAFWQCLGGLKHILRPRDTIAFPKNIGCGLGGANWKVIRTMIAQVLGEYDVYIYEL